MGGGEVVDSTVGGPAVVGEGVVALVEGDSKGLFFLQKFWRHADIGIPSSAAPSKSSPSSTYYAYVLYIPSLATKLLAVTTECEGYCRTAHNVILPIDLGKGKQSRMFSSPVTQLINRSTPMPNPP